MHANRHTHTNAFLSIGQPVKWLLAFSITYDRFVVRARASRAGLRTIHPPVHWARGVKGGAWSWHFHLVPRWSSTSKHSMRDAVLRHNGSWIFTSRNLYPNVTTSTVHVIASISFRFVIKQFYAPWSFKWSLSTKFLHQNISSTIRLSTILTNPVNNVIGWQSIVK